MEVGEKEIIYLSLHCHHQSDFCIKVGCDESLVVSVDVKHHLKNKEVNESSAAV